MMHRWLAMAGFATCLVVAGCEGEPKPTVEEQKPDFGAKSIDQMKNEIGVPGAKGQMQPTKPAAK